MSHGGSREAIEEILAGGGEVADEFAEGNLGGLLLVGDAEEAGELGFEMAECAEAGSGFREMIEGAAEEVVERRIGMVRLDGGLEKLAAVGGEKRGVVGFTEALAPIVDDDFAEGVEVAAARAGEIDLAAEEEIEFSCEGAFRAERAFRDGADEAVVFGEPVDDETGVGETGQAGDDGGHGTWKGLDPKSEIWNGENFS